MCTPVINKLTKIHASRPCIALGRIECPIEHSIGARFGVRHVSNNPSEHKSCRLRAPRRLQLVTQISQRRSPVSSKAASADSLVVTSTGTQLPRTPLAMVEQAADAIKSGLEGGRMRHQLVLLLPVNEKEADFTSTESIDYPCSLQKEFDTCTSLVISIMQRLLGAGTNINAKRIDDGGVEGDPCAVLFPDDKSAVAVVFPTSDKLKQIQEYAKQADRPLLIVNPQWNNSGQVISDFGIGPWKKAAEDFLATFEPSYVLKEKRIGSPGTVNASTGTRFVTGGVVRVLRQYPGEYEAHAMAADGSSQLLGTQGGEPSYQELDAMISRGRKEKMAIFDIAQRVTYVYQDGSEAEEAATQPGGGTDAAVAAMSASNEVAREGGLSDTDIAAMDGASLRRELLRLGLPTSGKMSKLRERLRDATRGK